MKAKHRRRRLWTMFVVLAALLLYCLHYGVFTRLSAWIPSPGPSTSREVVLDEPFAELVTVERFRFEDEAELARWEKKVFKGKTDFEIMRDAAAPYLSSKSANACCGLFRKTKHEATPEMHLSWKWRVREFPKKKDPSRLSNRAEDDFAARIYVIFEAANLFRSDVIEYVWDESLPPGTVADSPYSDRIKLFVIRSGASAEPEAWQRETRNPYEDYKMLFGKPPKNSIGIIAVMSDSDNTGTSAAADFEEIVLGTKKMTGETVR